jgi:hypothetical protein
MILHLRRRRQAVPAGPRTYIASNGQPVTVVPKTAIPLPADLGDGLDLSVAEDRQRWAGAEPAPAAVLVPLPAPAGPPWEGASATGLLDSQAGDQDWPSYLHDTMSDIPPVHDRPYAPKNAYVPELAPDLAELTIFRAAVRSELVRRDESAGGNRRTGPWQHRYFHAYCRAWDAADDLIWTGYVFADELRAAHADTLDGLRTHVDGLIAQMAGSAAAA